MLTINHSVTFINNGPTANDIISLSFVWCMVLTLEGAKKPKIVYLCAQRIYLVQYFYYYNMMISSIF